LHLSILFTFNVSRYWTINDKRIEEQTYDMQETGLLVAKEE